MEMYLPDFSTIRSMTCKDLESMGCGLWNQTGLMLFPFAWYEHIPDGFEIVFINGKKDVFEKGKTDDDTRFGLLAFGVIGLDVASMPQAVYWKH